MRYDYQCKSCDQVHEVSHSISEDPEISCPECGGSCKRLLCTNPSVIFVGSFPGKDIKREGEMTREDAAIKHAKTKGKELRAQGKMGRSEDGDFWTLNDVRKGKVPD